jgi:hypothetical protein
MRLLNFVIKHLKKRIHVFRHFKSRKKNIKVLTQNDVYGEFHNQG